MRARLVFNALVHQYLVPGVQLGSKIRSNVGGSLVDVMSATGPVLDEVAEVWDKIDADLAKSDVPTAAGRLRRHLEFVAADRADELAARVSFRAVGGYDTGELLSAVIGRQGELLKSAAKAAKSWDDAEAIAKVEALRQARQQILSEKE